MKKETDYLAPKVKFVECQCRRVICGSRLQNYTVTAEEEIE